MINETQFFTRRRMIVVRMNRFAKKIDNMSGLEKGNRTGREGTRRGLSYSPQGSHFKYLLNSKIIAYVGKSHSYVCFL